MKNRLIIIFSFSLLMISIYACNQSPDDTLANVPLNTTVEKIEDVEILYSDSAEVRVRITGPVMLNHLDRVTPRQEFTEGILVDFFGQSRQKEKSVSHLVANYAIRFEKEGKVICRDSVVWLSANGERLETEELIWEEKTAQIYTRKFAKITTPEKIIYGHGFTAKQDFTEARIKQVEGIIAIDDLE